ncbi:hypothetical protein MPSEU_000273300 [Mayamaea pseudoterrestris]|nr:hypothetical protein MPSEU_000273300 [Mayamaea pseudoterrestris]
MRIYSTQSDPNPLFYNGIQTHNKEDLPSFENVTSISDGTQVSLKRAGLLKMTEIQARTMDPIIKGQDVIARARTGTGKTLAFLIPAVERILKEQQTSSINSQGVQMLIVSPTRELAEQIHREASLLTQQHASINCQVMYGGVPKSHDVRRLQQQTPSILIATPGRLLDHLESTMLRDNSPFSHLMAETPILVLDEMDRLLEMGFSKDILEIISYLPETKQRQTLLFSATMPLNVKEMVQACVRSGDDVATIDCILDDDPSTHTNVSIEQTYVLLPPHRTVSGIIELILRLRRQSSNKIVVFFPTTAQVEYFHLLLTTLGHRVYQIHSKLNQAMRLSASDQFRFDSGASGPLSQKRAGAGPVLLTTDLSARGVDYPDVTHVVQIGASNSREMYLHRLGRTGRAGKAGQGILVLTDLELDFLQQDLAGLRLEMNHQLQGMLESSTANGLQNDLLRIHYEMRTGQADDLSEVAANAYRSILGYYSTRLRSLGVRSPELLVKFVNAFASQSGMVELPVVSQKLARQCGLLGNSRIRVDARWIPGNTFEIGGKAMSPKRR